MACLEDSGVSVEAQKQSFERQKRLRGGEGKVCRLGERGEVGPEG